MPNVKEFKFYATLEDKENDRPIELNSVGNVSDTLEVLEDGSAVWIRNTGEVTLKDNEAWEDAGQGDNVNGTGGYIGLRMFKNQTLVMCNQLDSTLNTGGKTDFVYQATNCLVINLNNTKIGASNDEPKADRLLKLGNYIANQFRIGNPYIVYGELATPITTIIPKELVPQITLESTNSLSVGGAVKPSSYNLIVPRHREPIQVDFTTSSIENHINIKVVSINELGENDMAKPTNIYVSPQPRWSYLLDRNQVILDWVDMFDFETGYRVQYRVNGLDYQYDYIDSSEVELGGRVRHYIPLSGVDTATIRICCVSNQDHFYSKPVVASKDRDMTILPPPDFLYKWADKGLLEFSWLDNYNCENGFNFRYSISDAPYVTEFIPSTSVAGQKTYTFQKQLQPYESISAEVAMTWDLNTSQSAKQSVIYIPIEAEPIKNVKRERTETGIIVEWTPQAYVEKYEVHYVVDGVDTIYETNNNTFPIEIDYSITKQIEIYVIAHLTGGAVSDKSNTIIFTPTELKELLESMIYDVTQSSYHLNSTFTHLATAESYDIHTKTWGKVEQPFVLNTKYVDRFQMEDSLVGTTIWKKGAETPYEMIARVSDLMRIQFSDSILSTFMTSTKEEYINESTIRTLIRDGYTINMEINKPRIATLGDSITAGHPGFWAESGTGDERSQYQYWLSGRLRGGFEVINKGYGRDTTSLLLSRFERDLAPLNAQFCLIQIGTNDIFEAQKAGKDDQEILNTFLGNMRANVMEMINICRKYNIIPIIGNLIPRTGFKGIYREGLWSHNQWIMDYCNSNEDVLYVDFYNAGKQNIPPTPLEDPNEVGAMNPIYDGDTVYDSHGNVLVRGNGIHPDIQGYKLMGEAVPLRYFQTTDGGLKIYIDEDCKVEEQLDETNTIQKVYKMNIPNIIRGKKKFTTRYVKNTGIDQLMYAIFPMEEKGVKVSFKLEDGVEKDFANGVLLPTGVHRLDIFIDVPREGEIPELYLGVATRPRL